MNGHRGRPAPARPPPEDHEPAVTAKPNRLSRTFRRTQQTQAASAEVLSPECQQPEFKTPTRIPRSRAAGGFGEESPHNDSDLQQDIVWDATSPSPQRLGKRGKKPAVGRVDISEIVSRIAPKHGRPKVVEPTLQQWIGDSAAIPCTPDIKAPKPKKKSPRPNGVDDLLKLAKQFDFNMFRQDEEEVEDMHQQSLELLSGDIFDFENGGPGDVPAGTDGQVCLGRHVDEDLDFLFDGPTQRLSGGLSPSASKEACGKAGGPLANDEFEDDWENDDLLNDSLVVEMTQHPQNVMVPKHCSTQRPPSEREPSRLQVPPGVGPGRSAASSQENVKHRTTDNLESNPKISMERKNPNTNLRSLSSSRSKPADKNSEPKETRAPSSAVGSSPQRPEWDGPGCCDSPSSTETKVACNLQNNKTPAVSDFQDDGLDSFFLSESVWDDPVDDELLCEMCEDVENEIQRAGNVSTAPARPVGHTSQQRPALQTSHRAWDNRSQRAACQLPAAFPATAVTGAAAGLSAAPASRSGTRSSSAWPRGSSRTPLAAVAPPGRPNKDQFTFSKTNNLVSMVTNKAKCSAAEIERKKQQAMERRRLRLQALQTL
ncbi:ewing's tumor-associated antigen 1 [Aulostomus maculatus]